jgi:hypothetical protein
MSTSLGLSVFAFFCAARKIFLSVFMAFSSALIDLSLPTNNGTTMAGNTTMSRNGSSGMIKVSGAPSASSFCRILLNMIPHSFPYGF